MIAGVVATLLCGEVFAGFNEDLAAAKRGDAEAQFNVGVSYANGEGVSKNLFQAVYWFRKAAEQGHANAQYNLGVCYYDGEGVSKNLFQAVYWFRIAAEQCFPGS